MHGTGSAPRDAASILGAGQLQIVPQHPKQRRRWIVIEVRHGAVDVKSNHMNLLSTD
jgi:hypothetical protein